MDLVFNGDTFDLLKTHHITGEVAVGKMAAVAGAHPGFFEGLRDFLDHDGAARRALFVAGNHQEGCMRNEYMIVDGGRTLRPMPKSYAEAYCKDGVPVRSQLVEIAGPPALPGYVPESIFDILPEVRRLQQAS